jgi:hypothetical protein
MSMGHVWALFRTTLEVLAVGERDPARELTARIREASESADADLHDAPVLREIAAWLGAAVELFGGTPEPLLTRSEQTWRVLETTGHDRYGVLVSLHAAIAAAAASKVEPGLAWAKRSFEGARRFGLRSYELRARSWVALFFFCSGLDDAAVVAVREVLRDAGDDRVVAGEARVTLAHVLASGGEGEVDAALGEAFTAWNDVRLSLDTRGRAGQLIQRLGRNLDADTAHHICQVLMRVRVFGDAFAFELVPKERERPSHKRERGATLQG